MSTSVGGVLTGPGGDVLIIDDPLKPADAFSEILRQAVNDWYDNTLLSRLNNKKGGVIIVVMQRLHQDDLVGHLLELDTWDVIRFPAIAEEDETHEAETEFGPIQYKRRAAKFSIQTGKAWRPFTEFSASWGNMRSKANTSRIPFRRGAIIKTDWLRYYGPEELPTRFSTKIQSWDTASKSGEFNDYIVCTTWGVIDKRFYLIDLYRERLEYPDLRRAVKEHFSKHAPNTVFTEDKGSGTQLLQNLRMDEVYRLKAYCPPPSNDKQMRLFAQSAVFENGRVWLPKASL